MNTLMRWCKFNLVGAVGMALQLGALAIFNRMWAGHYLVATAAALELTLVHNFVWHLNYTWRDRSGRDWNCHGTLAGQLRRFQGDSAQAGPCRAGASCWSRRLECIARRYSLPGIAFLRFHLSNGLVSMLGNLALMPVLVEGARIPVVASNGIVILCCSIVNFCLGNEWVFAAGAQARQDRGLVSARR